MPGVIPREGARTYEITLRVSPNTDWKHLMQPYKDYFQRTHGPVKYRFNCGADRDGTGHPAITVVRCTIRSGCGSSPIRGASTATAMTCCRG